MRPESRTTIDWLAQHSPSASAAAKKQAALDIVARSRTSVLPWRGQFSPQLIEYFLTQYDGPRILDPFCGSGTVLYEAANSGRSAFGLDINPAAVMLASFAHYCRMPISDRLEVADQATSAIQRALSVVEGETVTLDICTNLPRNPFVHCYLLTIFGDKSEVQKARAMTAISQMRMKLLALPVTEAELLGSLGDARYTNFDSGFFQLLITSPPYINVFNYHQHYRAVTEALGAKPLTIATAEIGSNRKHRQNRFMTVIQYCIDMELVFAEIWRVLDTNGVAVFVVGRSSKVKGVSFLNADLIVNIVQQAGSFLLRDQQTRMFTNRFGESIYEAVLVFQKILSSNVSLGEDIGRSVGSDALLKAAHSCSDVVIRSEIEEAYERRDCINRSPRVI